MSQSNFEDQLKNRVRGVNLNSLRRNPDAQRASKDHQRQYAEEMRAQIEADNQRVAKLRESKAEANAKAWRESIEDRWRDAELASITDPNHRAALESRMQRHRERRGLNRTSFLLGGPMGRGKTYFGYAYIYEMIRQGFILPSQVFADSEPSLATISGLGFKKEERLQQLLSRRYSVYLIDDVGRGKFSSAFDRGELWYALMNHIYQNRLTLIMTTNLPINKREKDSISQWLGEAAVDRLRHIVGGEGVLAFQGANMRQQLGDAWEQSYQQGH